MAAVVNFWSCLDLLEIESLEIMPVGEQERSIGLKNKNGLSEMRIS